MADRIGSTVEESYELILKLITALDAYAAEAKKRNEALHNLAYGRSGSGQQERVELFQDEATRVLNTADVAQALKALGEKLTQADRKIYLLQIQDSLNSLIHEFKQARDRYKASIENAGGDESKSGAGMLEKLLDKYNSSALQGHISSSISGIFDSLLSLGSSMHKEMRLAGLPDSEVGKIYDRVLKKLDDSGINHPDVKKNHRRFTASVKVLATTAGNGKTSPQKTETTPAEKLPETVPPPVPKPKQLIEEKKPEPVKIPVPDSKPAKAEPKPPTAKAEQVADAEMEKKIAEQAKENEARDARIRELETKLEKLTGMIGQQTAQEPKDNDEAIEALNNRISETNIRVEGALKRLDRLSESMTDSVPDEGKIKEIVGELLAPVSETLAQIIEGRRALEQTIREMQREDELEENPDGRALNMRIDRLRDRMHQKFEDRDKDTARLARQLRHELHQHEEMLRANLREIPVLVNECVQDHYRKKISDLFDDTRKKLEEVLSGLNGRNRPAKAKK